MKRHLTSAFLAVAVAIAPTTITLPAAQGAPEAGTVRDCRNTAYTRQGWQGFEDATSFLNDRFGEPNHKNVWQAPDEDAIWDAYCAATGTQAYQESDGANVILAAPVNPYTLPEDGTTVFFRPSSNSGGMALDVIDRRNGGKTKYKVHLSKEG